jgi:hypothetical protein
MPKMETMAIGFFAGSEAFSLAKIDPVFINSIIEYQNKQMSSKGFPFPIPVNCQLRDLAFQEFSCTPFSQASCYPL